MGKIYGNYEIVELSDGQDYILGKGGQGVTYLVRHIALESQWALKVIKDVEDRADRDHFLREARCIAGLPHPNIVMVVDCGEQQGVLYSVFEYCAHGSLANYVAQFGPMSWPAVLHIAKQMAQALYFVHTCNRPDFPNGLLHRDVKPENIMVTQVSPSLHVKLIDFGVAGILHKDSSASTFGGDPEAPHMAATELYASPEQILAHELGYVLDERSDLFSLGVTLLYLLCGGNPFKNAAGQPLSKIELRKERCGKIRESYQKYFPADLPESVINLLLHLLEKDRDRRCSSAKNLLELIDKIENAPAPTDASSSSFASSEIVHQPEAIPPLPIASFEDCYRNAEIKRVFEDMPGARFYTIQAGNYHTSLLALYPRDLLGVINDSLEYFATAACIPSGFVVQDIFFTSEDCQIILPSRSELPLADIVKHLGTASLDDALGLLASIATEFDRFHLPQRGITLEIAPWFIRFHPDDVSLERLVKTSRWSELRDLRCMLLPRFGKQDEDMTQSVIISANQQQVSFPALIYFLLAGRLPSEHIVWDKKFYVALSSLSEEGNRLLCDAIHEIENAAPALVTLREIAESQGVSLPSSEPTPPYCRMVYKSEKVGLTQQVRSYMEDCCTLINATGGISSPVHPSLSGMKQALLAASNQLAGHLARLSEEEIDYSTLKRIHEASFFTYCEIQRWQDKANTLGIATSAEQLRIQQEADAKLLAEQQRLELEAARIRAEQEAERIRAEQAAIEKIKTEQESARIKAEQVAARIRAEQAAIAKIKAEQEAERVRAEQAAIAKIKAEQDAAANLEAERIRELEVARIKAEIEKKAKIQQETIIDQLHPQSNQPPPLGQQLPPQTITSGTTVPKEPQNQPGGKLSENKVSNEASPEITKKKSVKKILLGTVSLLAFGVVALIAMPKLLDESKNNTDQRNDLVADDTVKTIDKGDTKKTTTTDPERKKPVDVVPVELPQTTTIELNTPEYLDDWTFYHCELKEASIPEIRKSKKLGSDIGTHPTNGTTEIRLYALDGNNVISFSPFKISQAEIDVENLMVESIIIDHPEWKFNPAPYEIPANTEVAAQNAITDYIGSKQSLSEWEVKPSSKQWKTKTSNVLKQLRKTPVTIPAPLKSNQGLTLQDVWPKNTRELTLATKNIQVSNQDKAWKYLRIGHSCKIGASELRLEHHHDKWKSGSISVIDQALDPNEFFATSSYTPSELEERIFAQHYLQTTVKRCFDLVTQNQISLLTSPEGPQYLVEEVIFDEKSRKSFRYPTNFDPFIGVTFVINEKLESVNCKIIHSIYLANYKAADGKQIFPIKETFAKFTTNQAVFYDKNKIETIKNRDNVAQVQMLYLENSATVRDNFFLSVDEHRNFTQAESNSDEIRRSTKPVLADLVAKLKAPYYETISVNFSVSDDRIVWKIDLKLYDTLSDNITEFAINLKENHTDKYKFKNKKFSYTSSKTYHINY
jgi:serine/threonine protein kinase